MAIAQNRETAEVVENVWSWNGYVAIISPDSATEIKLVGLSFADQKEATSFCQGYIASLKDSGQLSGRVGVPVAVPMKPKIITQLDLYNELLSCLSEEVKIYLAKSFEL